MIERFRPAREEVEEYASLIALHEQLDERELPRIVREAELQLWAERSFSHWVAQKARRDDAVGAGSQPDERRSARDAGVRKFRELPQTRRGALAPEQSSPSAVATRSTTR